MISSWKLALRGIPARVGHPQHQNSEASPNQPTSDSTESAEVKIVELYH